MKSERFWWMAAVFLTSALFAFSLPAWATTLLWTPAEGEVDGYRIYASTDRGITWISHGEAAHRANEGGYIEYEFADPTAVTLFRVSAYNAVGESPLTKLVVGFDPMDQLAPPDWGDNSSFGGVQ